MAISEALKAEILRFYFVEHWRVGTIARQLGVHHSTVRRVLSQAGIPAPCQSTRASIVDPYLPFIVETLEKYPKLTASRLYEASDFMLLSAAAGVRSWLMQDG